VHVAVVVALRAEQSLARSAALLLAITMTTLMLVLAAAAATSAVTVSDRALPFLIATAAALVAASVYGLVAGLLVVEVRTSRAP
jgi:sulfite exporter TauE/SafE